MAVKRITVDDFLSDMWITSHFQDGRSSVSLLPIFPGCAQHLEVWNSQRSCGLLSIEGCRQQIVLQCYL